MDYKVIIQKRAELEIEEAIFYYNNLQNNLGKRFLLDYENQLNTLNSFPFFEIKYNEIRVLRFNKFPYSIHFSIDENEKTVYILAITSNYQDPNITRIKF
ncbi:type II toxin-antitoxin system RelE/ParE family toxin [Flavobacterium aquiphilum]|uniref:type II toxin-antitoxin system RelE/ParE family toxin n=1 Tax=Flavobacterium aquiphilum TaxID=3003261 RepID=UPI0024802810|nr:type II toxin-antitoxin system RelE/ParE family toxin [Flavobacterium aquiphilum]